MSSQTGRIVEVTLENKENDFFFGNFCASVALPIETLKRETPMQIEKQLLTKYFLGQVSEEEKEKIHQWLLDSEDHKASFIRERIRFDASVLAGERKPKAKKRFKLIPSLIWGSKIAASALFILGSFFFYHNYRMAQMCTTYQSIKVPSGSRTNLILSDGTSVWLNANTTFRYPQVFSKKSREVFLDGEAYFDVKKGDAPFIVKTGKYNVEVLGTQFDVEAYSDKSKFETTLYTGKVKLYNFKTTVPVFLLPGQTAYLSGHVLKVSTDTRKSRHGWKDGLIYIENESFEEIMAILEKYFSVRIVIKNKKVYQLGYEGKIRISDGIDHALRVLQKDYPFDYERDEESNVIFIN